MKSFPENKKYPEQVNISKGVPEGFMFLDVDSSIADSAGIPYKKAYHGSEYNKSARTGWGRHGPTFKPIFGPVTHGIVIHTENLPKIMPYLPEALQNSIKEKAKILSNHRGAEKNLTEQFDEDIASIKSNKTIPTTVKKLLIDARKGQEKFREDVIEIEKRCRITGVEDRRFLIASHIKPWCKSSNEERLDGYNGLLLSPHIDKLFDAFYISFENDGTVLISETAQKLIDTWKIDTKIVGAFHPQQKKYLKFHRERFRTINNTF